MESGWDCFLLAAKFVTHSYMEYNYAEIVTNSYMNYTVRPSFVQLVMVLQLR